MATQCGPPAKPISNAVRARVADIDSNQLRRLLAVAVGLKVTVKYGCHRLQFKQAT
jgi:hypothetical protein